MLSKYEYECWCKVEQHGLMHLSPQMIGLPIEINANIRECKSQLVDWNISPMNYRKEHDASTLAHSQSFKIDSIPMDGNWCIMPGLNPMNDQEHGGMTAQVYIDLRWWNHASNGSKCSQSHPWSRRSILWILIRHVFIVDVFLDGKILREWYYTYCLLRCIFVGHSAMQAFARRALNLAVVPCDLVPCPSFLVSSLIFLISWFVRPESRIK